MADPYVGEVRCFGFNFAPYQWALCNGQLMAITQNQALFAILGTTYGGNGVSTFALPNLQGQIPMHWGNGPGGFNTVIGEVQGQPTVTLLTSQIPLHTHTVSSATVTVAAERSATPSSTSFLSESKGAFVYQNPPVTTNAPFSPKAISPNGNSQPHDNMQPYLVLNFCISLYGVFPSRG
jgi:microcystin-dependent protein